MKKNARKAAKARREKKGGGGPENFNAAATNNKEATEDDGGHVSAGSSADEAADLTSHLGELRAKIINSLIFFCAALALTLYFSDAIMEVFVSGAAKALKGEKLVFISPAEAFFVTIQMSIYSALLISVPFVLYQMWSFVYIALDDKEKKYFTAALLFSTACFYAGCAFAVFAAIPVGLGFLVGYSGAIFRPMISVAAYCDFLVYTSLTFGVVFELPLLMIFSSLTGIISPKTFSSGRKYAILLIFIAAGVFSPPDVISQFLVAIPMLILYETGIIAVRLLGIK
jgi:sec-independent protein translocase protein TatC